MQNIDLIFFLQPIIIIIICTALLIYWRHARHFRSSVLSYTFLAYFVAIALKSLVQTLGSALNVNLDLVGLGIYYGLQTVVFEVGLAYIIAWYAISKGGMGKDDAEAYGAGLAFWENAVLLGILPLLALTVYVIILSTGTGQAQMLYGQLESTSPDLFDPAGLALGLVSLGIMERISSILLHSAWGYLCFVAALSHKVRFLLVALPMGFVDFLVPFAPALNLPVYEAIVMAIAVLSVFLAWFVTRPFRMGSDTRSVEEVR